LTRSKKFLIPVSERLVLIFKAIGLNDENIKNGEEDDIQAMIVDFLSTRHLMPALNLIISDVENDNIMCFLSVQFYLFACCFSFFHYRSWKCSMHAILPVKIIFDTFVPYAYQCTCIWNIVIFIC
jgi:hypothetical protein